MKIKTIFLAGIITFTIVNCIYYFIGFVQKESNKNGYKNIPTTSTHSENFEKGIDIPYDFKMSENVMSIGVDFDITDLQGNNVGIVKERIFNITKTFEYQDNVGTLKARAEESFLSWGVEIVVYDERNKIIGYIQENILDGLFSIKTIYSILDVNKNKIATSKKLDFIGTDIDIYTENNLSVAMNRPYFNVISDTWTINIKDTKIDKRIAVFIPAYKTSVDNDRREEEDKKNKDE